MQRRPVRRDLLGDYADPELARALRSRSTGHDCLDDGDRTEPLALLVHYLTHDRGSAEQSASIMVPGGCASAIMLAKCFSPYS
jgi:hypothetical protein